MSKQKERALRQFARAMLQGYVEHECGDLDGHWVETLALDLGLLVPAGRDGEWLTVPAWLRRTRLRKDFAE